MFAQAEDMPAELAQEAIEIISAAIDKFVATENYEVRNSISVESFSALSVVCTLRDGKVC